MNFLPFEEQIKIKKIYKKKFFILLVFTIFFVSLINLILIFPSYVFLKIKNNGLKNDIKILLTDSNFLKSNDMNDSLKDLALNIPFLKTAEKEVIEFSDILKEIIKLKNSSISLSSVFFEKDKITLLGKSKNREKLLLFVQNLKENIFFKNVEYPASNLLRKENIDFTLTVFLK